MASCPAPSVRPGAARPPPPEPGDRPARRGRTGAAVEGRQSATDAAVAAPRVLAGETGIRSTSSAGDPATPGGPPVAPLAVGVAGPPAPPRAGIEAMPTAGAEAMPTAGGGGRRVQAGRVARVLRAATGGGAGARGKMALDVPARPEIPEGIPERQRVRRRPALPRLGARAVPPGVERGRLLASKVRATAPPVGRRGAAGPPTRAVPAVCLRRGDSGEAWLDEVCASYESPTPAPRPMPGVEPSPARPVMAMARAMALPRRAGRQKRCGSRIRPTPLLPGLRRRGAPARRAPSRPVATHGRTAGARFQRRATVSTSPSRSSTS